VKLWDDIGKVFTAPGSELNAVQVIARTAIIFVVAIMFVRLAKKRFIAQRSAMDIVVVVVFGSLLSRAINGSGTLVSCLAASLTMLVLHRGMEMLARRSQWFEALVKGHSNVLVKDGIVDRDQMARHDITAEDLVSEMRTNALTQDLAKVELAVLERGGQISIVKRRGQP
jgi:uncharacterized membrane protein YcaP (DUF421 family)